MRKYLLTILIIILLVAGVVVGLLLVQQRQIFNQKASTPTGTATVSLQPSQASFQRSVANPVSVYFNTKGISISGITVRLTFSNLGVSASGIQVSSNLLTSGDWTCPVKSITSSGSTGQIDIACLNTSTAGYSNSTDTLLATFNLTASAVPLVNPLIVSFDPTQTVITQKSDATDIALTPTSTGSYTIVDTLSGSPTATPVVIVASPTATPLGGATNAPTPTATATTVAVATNTPTPTASGSATAVSMPVTGFDAPTIVGIAAGGFLLLVGAMALIL